MLILINLSGNFFKYLNGVRVAPNTSNIHTKLPTETKEYRIKTKLNVSVNVGGCLLDD